VCGENGGHVEDAGYGPYGGLCRLTQRFIGVGRPLAGQFQRESDPAIL
jgi:hypothetical protein